MFGRYAPAGTSYTAGLHIYSFRHRSPVRVRPERPETDGCGSLLRMEVTCPLSCRTAGAIAFIARNKRGYGRIETVRPPWAMVKYIIHSRASGKGVEFA